MKYLVGKNVCPQSIECDGCALGMLSVKKRQLRYKGWEKRVRVQKSIYSGPCPSECMPFVLENALSLAYVVNLLEIRHVFHRFVESSV